MHTGHLRTAKAIAAVALVGAFAGVPAAGANAAVVGVGQVESLKPEAPIANVYWRYYPHYHHHHCCGSSTYTQLTQTGAVSYPVYRIDHYKVDYSSPTYLYPERCTGWGWGW